jgi:redox-sensitive bicupin YhaK (pirin superfamily)
MRRVHFHWPVDRICCAPFKGDALVSWLPSNEASQGDARSHGAIELLVTPRSRDIGGFSVYRSLPHGRRQMVGPFIFFDQMGPVQFVPGQGMDVRPHPHIGLATVTYLFDGRVVHRDSEGSCVEIVPGEMNLMTAGRGIVHSERTPEDARAGGLRMFGIQSWIALPASYEDIAPSFQHFDAAKLPLVEDRGISARIIAGSAFGKTSPVNRISDWHYVEISLNAAATIPYDPEPEQRAAYLVEGEIAVAGERFAAPCLIVFRPNDPITLQATRPARLMFLGGAALEGPRYIWWNFVSSRKDRIEQAKQDWKFRRFALVPGESEFVPLPEG